MGANPSSSDLLVGVVASPENTSVECKGHYGGDVGCLDGALCRVFAMVSANVRVVEGVACGLDIHSEGVCGLLLLPVVDKRVNCINEMSRCCGTELKKPTRSSLVACRGISAGVCVCKVAMEVAPELWNGQLAWMLWEKVLQNDVERSAGDA